MGSYNDTSITALKRRIYFFIFLFALAGALVAFGLTESFSLGSAFSRNILILVSGYHLAMMLILWFFKTPLRFVEVSMAVVATLALLSVFYYALNGEHEQLSTQFALVNMYLWMPMAYLSIFLVFEVQRALLGSSLVLLLIVLLSLPHIIGTPHGTNALLGFTTLGQLYMSNAVIIAALFFFATLQKHVQSARSVAAQMQRLAHTDALTGLANRRQLEVLIQKEIYRVARYNKPLSVIVMDIDNFKLINDNYGHDTGDQVLLRLARAIEPGLRNSDSLGRWGGEEFVIVTPETDLSQAHKLAELIRRRVAGYDFGHGRQVTISSGVAAYQPEDNLYSLIKRADTALYQAKTAGRNQVASQGLAAEG